MEADSIRLLATELVSDTVGSLVGSLPTGDKTMTEPWSSVDEVARHLGVAKDSIYRWIENKGLPAHKIGRLWKFKLTEVDAWVRSRGTDDQIPGGHSS
jgi:excisionase family DNA binding protein